MKIAVVTANFGNFDSVKPIPEQDIAFDRHYFTEENNPYPMDGLNNRLKGKYFKILTHRILPEYDVYIWVDGNVQIKSSSMIRKMAEGCKDVLISPHPIRKTIYEEAAFIINSIKRGDSYLSSRYNAESIRRYVENIGPGRQGLYYCGLFARKNTPHINKIFEQWWTETMLWANFDQIEFVRVAEYYSLDLEVFRFGDFYNNEYYSLSKHL